MIVTKRMIPLPVMQLQVLQLPDDLATAVYQASSAQLDSCLTQLPPHLHKAALRACFPAVVTQGVLRIDSACSRWPVAKLPRSSQEADAEYYCVAQYEVLCVLLNAIASFPQLREVHLDVSCDALLRNDEVSNDVQAHAAQTMFCSMLSTLSQLQALSVGNFLISKPHCHKLNWCKEGLLDELPLERFAMVQGRVQLTTDLVACLERCTGLKSLHLRSLFGLSIPVPYWSRLCLPHLHHLSLPEASLTTEGVEALSEGVTRLPALRSLRLPGLRSVPIPGFMYPNECVAEVKAFTELVKACASLTTLVRYLLSCL
jgi:hypothetical protein